MSTVVGADAELEIAAVENIIHSYLAADPVDVLIRDGAFEMEFGGAHRQGHGALGQSRAVGAGDSHVDGAGIGAGSDDEIVFEVGVTVAVVQQIDAGIDGASAYAGESGDAGAPIGWIGSHQVVHLGGQFGFTTDAGGRSAGYQPKARGARDSG